MYESVVSKHRMTDATLERVIRDMFSFSDAPTFVWHGGEPTLAGLEFFVGVTNIQKFYAKGRPYYNSLQTNGTLINEEWTHFLKKENFMVGISLDGPEDIHDHYRKDHNGNGTFRKVFDKAAMLLEHKVAVNILTTVNSHSVKYPEKLYKFFVKNGFYFMQFIPVVEQDSLNPEIAAPYSVDAGEYGIFLNRLFNLWIKDFDTKRLKQKTAIRFFDTLIQKYVGMTPDHCIFQKECVSYLVVEHNGDIFPCDYLVSQDSCIGNIYKTSICNAFNSDAHINFGKQKADLGVKCQCCQWLDLCYGGCIKDRIRDPRDNGHNHFCQSYQLFFRHAEKNLKKLARLYRNNYLN